jgi:hypothetical protein
MSGNPLLLPSKHSARPNRSMQNQQSTCLVWASQDNLSSEFDVPYSPIINEPSDLQKSPDPGGLGQRLKHALLPAILVALLPSGTTKSRPRSLWDRVVFVMFCGCLFLLSYMLAGFGYSGHDDTTCTSFSTGPTAPSALSDTMAPSTSLLKGPTNEDLEESLNWESDESQHQDHRIMMESFHVSDASTFELPVSNSAPTAPSSEHSHESPLKQHDAQVPIANPPNLRYFANRVNDPFDLEPFFDGGGYGYGNDGQAFALKIHIPPDSSSSRAVHHGENSKRCRGSGRC